MVKQDSPAELTLLMNILIRSVGFGHWKDTAVILKGEAVWNMTVMFLHMWNELPIHPSQLTNELHLTTSFSSRLI